MWRNLSDLADTAVKGVIIPDLPHEHANLEPLADRYFCLDSLVSLTTAPELKRVDQEQKASVHAAANRSDREISNTALWDATLGALHQLTSQSWYGLGVFSHEDVERFSGVRWRYRRFECKSLHQGEPIEGLYQTSSSFKIITQVRCRRQNKRKSFLFLAKRKAKIPPQKQTGLRWATCRTKMSTRS